MRDWEDIKEDILSRVDFRQVAEWDGLAMKKGGAAFGWRAARFTRRRVDRLTLAERRALSIGATALAVAGMGTCLRFGWSGEAVISKRR